MFIRYTPNGLDLDDQDSFHQQVGEVFAEDRSVLIIHLQRMLLLDLQPLLPQPIRESIPIDFLQMTMAMILVDGETCFPHGVTQPIDLLSIHVAPFSIQSNCHQEARESTKTNSLFVHFRAFSWPSLQAGGDNDVNDLGGIRGLTLQASDATV